MDVPEKVDSLVQYLHQQYIPQDISFDILSTIRYDPQLTDLPPFAASEIKKENLFLFDEHYQRLLYTIQYFCNGSVKFAIDESSLLEQLINAIDKSGLPLFSPKKIRLLVDLNGSVKIELYEIPMKDNLLLGYDDSLWMEAPIWDVFVDDESTFVSPFTSFKTTNRGVYTSARQRMLPGLKPGLEEVLLVNTQGQVMEGSITNVAIRNNNNKWITPPLSTGCLCGVMRNYLVTQGMVKEDFIQVSQLKKGTQVLLFNGIMGVVRGQIVQERKQTN